MKIITPCYPQMNTTSKVSNLQLLAIKVPSVAQFQNRRLPLLKPHTPSHHCQPAFPNLKPFQAELCRGLALTQSIVDCQGRSQTPNLEPQTPNLKPQTPHLIPHSTPPPGSNLSNTLDLLLSPFRFTNASQPLSSPPPSSAASHSLCTCSFFDRYTHYIMVTASAGMCVCVRVCMRACAGARASVIVCIVSFRTETKDSFAALKADISISVAGITRP